MRFSQVKATTYALLGIGSFLLGVNASPTNIHEGSVITESQNLVVRAKDPLEDFNRLGYQIIEPGFEIPRKPKLYKIERKGVPGVIDQISVDKNEKSITVANADNDRIDKGEGLGQFGKEKLKLSQIMMAVFVEKSKLNPKDLAIVRFALVSESDTKLAIEAAHKKLKIGEGGVVEVDSDSDDEKEEIFKDLKKTTLGKATEWLHKEFDAGEIKKIRITGGMQQGTMTIYLDD